MEIMLFVIGFLVYSLLAFLSYNSSIKSSNYYFLIGIIFSIVANVIWLTIAKMEHDSNKLIIKGLVWDILLTTAYIIVPIMFYNARLSSHQSVGILLILMGIIMLHK